MNRTTLARLVRGLIVAAAVVVVVVVVVEGVGLLLRPTDSIGVLLPFAAAAICAVGLALLAPRISRLVTRLTHHRETTPYMALADAAARIRAGSLEEALPGLAEVVAEGTSAARGEVWLAVGDRLVLAAQHPAQPTAPASTQPGNLAVDNLAVLLTRDDTDHVVPILDGTELRAAITVGKPGASITPADQQLMRDVANGAAMLLRGVSQNAELAERVRRADELAATLQASRARLARARDMERRRLVVELSHATTDRLSGLRADVVAAQTAVLTEGSEDGAVAAQRLADARTGLDELLDRFRVIARGVYPNVLRDHGPVGALDEVVADLPRAVALGGTMDERLSWEIESGIYYVAAAVLKGLAEQAADEELGMTLDHADGRVTLAVDDDCAPVGLAVMRETLADEAERLSALGGAVELEGTELPPGGGPAHIVVRAWIPDRLEPLVDVGGAVSSAVRG
ncbi:MAG: hypothetical protein J0I34_04205 [Pseudonocardia sp.]|uniref:hypothetical protein n=1 Tax=unclassified Pseudonocardia TaxID=2619320 RepID=UPI0008683C5B|nr:MULTISPECIES: hypothetical protein [unclassified Pseudonocardia]MBN9107965.1 hypothetical protein [Pseudonocardia sp.]ODU24188.1 MAG: hypothetical protein ABS80_13255 [Pseudonocardia sp. SCN 72-51]ODV07364.1 MAG: hypothetical protein ABT15_07560 [Pseudonocardia sp. SCN 73-27]